MVCSCRNEGCARRRIQGAARNAQQYVECVESILRRVSCSWIVLGGFPLCSVVRWSCCSAAHGFASFSCTCRLMLASRSARVAALIWQVIYRYTI